MSSTGDFVIEKGVLKRYIGNEADVALPDDVRTIGPEAFRDCVGVKTVTMSDTVTSIGKQAFCDCTGLVNVTLSNSIKNIGEGAFKGCVALTHIALPTEMPVIMTELFAHCHSLKEVTIPRFARVIKDNAFCDCPSLKDITIPDTVMDISELAFSEGTMLNYTHIGENNARFRELDGDVYTKDYKTLLLYAKGKDKTEFSVPNFVTKIGRYAFSASQTLQRVNIGKAVTVILDNTFSGCSNLREVFIPSGVQEIGQLAFASTSSSLTIYTPSGSAAEAFASRNNIPVITSLSALKADDANKEGALLCEAEFVDIHKEICDEALYTGSWCYVHDQTMLNVAGISVDNIDYAQRVLSKIHLRTKQALELFAQGKTNNCLFELHFDIATAVALAIKHYIAPNAIIGIELETSKYSDGKADLWWVLSPANPTGKLVHSRKEYLAQLEAAKH